MAEHEKLISDQNKQLKEFASTVPGLRKNNGRKTDA